MWWRVGEDGWRWAVGWVRVRKGEWEAGGEGGRCAPVEGFLGSSACVWRRETLEAQKLTAWETLSGTGCRSTFQDLEEERPVASRASRTRILQCEQFPGLGWVAMTQERSQSQAHETALVRQSTVSVVKRLRRLLNGLKLDDSGSSDVEDAEPLEARSVAAEGGPSGSRAERTRTKPCTKRNTVSK